MAMPELEEQTDEQESAEPTEPPTVGDTIRAAIEVEKEAADEAQADDAPEGDKGAPEEAAESDITKAARVLAKSKKPRQPKGGKQTSEPDRRSDEPGVEALPPEPEGESQGEKLEPPARWPVPSKEEFHKLPDVAKREVLDFWKGIEGNTTKLWQDLNREKSRYEQLDRVISHYLPKWNLRGMTDVQAVAELCATQDLFAEDPVKACDLILQKSGISPEQVAAYRNGGARTEPQTQADPHISALTQRVDEIYNQFQQNQVSVQQQTLQQAQADVEMVRNERSPDGRYLYPELWNEAQLQRVQPLVEDLRKTQPGIGWGEATKRAVQVLRMLDGNVSPLLGSPSPNGSRLSQEDLAKQRKAAVSIRSRGNASVPTLAKAKPGETIADSVRSALAALRSDS